MDNHQRVLRIQQIQKQQGVAAQDSCWSCRYREPGQGLADCQHPVREYSRRCREARSVDGLCGPSALLYTKPGPWQWLRWARYLAGHRPDYLGGKDVRPEP